MLELYQMGSEGPQWWHDWPDTVRGLPTGGILDRCSATLTCPKIVETFGGAEVFALKMTTSWVGTDPTRDIPLPDNVRRYYLPSSTHGGSGNFDEAPADTGSSCPGNNWGFGTLRPNPVPATQLVNRMRVALREWVLNDTAPPPSRWPLMNPAGDAKAKEKLATLSTMIDESDHAPTKGAQEVFAMLSAQVQEAQGRLRTLLEEDVARFSEVVRDAGIPAIVP